jgi:hypothetical protein
MNLRGTINAFMMLSVGVSNERPKSQPPHDVFYSRSAGERSKRVGAEEVQLTGVPYFTPSQVSNRAQQILGERGSRGALLTEWRDLARINRALSAAAAATRTGMRRGPVEATVARRARCRHVNTKLVAMPCRRAISVTAPGASVSSMIRILSSRDQRRRRSTPPRTSTRINRP